MSYIMRYITADGLESYEASGSLEFIARQCKWRFGVDVTAPTYMHVKNREGKDALLLVSACKPSWWDRVIGGWQEIRAMTDRTIAIISVIALACVVVIELLGLLYGR